VIGDLATYQISFTSVIVSCGMAELAGIDATGRVPTLEEAIQRLQRYQPTYGSDTTALFFETMLQTSPLEQNPHIMAWILSPTLPAPWEPPLPSEVLYLLEQMVLPRHFEVQSKGSRETAETTATTSKDEVEDTVLRERCKWWNYFLIQPCTSPYSSK
jgi:hypothetical protein